ncbi:MAG: FG-GAP-like repeat-containing protein, partial [Xanthomonadales bacterium]
MLACQEDGCQVYDYFPVRGYLSSMNTPLLIGLGEDTLIQRLEISWPSGKKQTLTAVRAGQQLTVDEAAALLDAAEMSAPTHTLFRKEEGLLNYRHQESDFVDFRQVPTQQRMLTRNGPTIVQGDFNRDGRPDVVVGGAYLGSPTVVYHQQANGRFLPADTLPTHQLEVGAIAVLDANGDGKQDIYIAPGASERPLNVREAFQPLLFLGTERGFQLDPALPQVHILSHACLAEDLDGDGHTDLLTGGGYIPGSYPLTSPGVLLLNRKGKLHREPAPWMPQELAVEDMLAADIDQDG